MTQNFNKMQLVKRRFFAMRNGAVAKSMRDMGAPYRIIFGMTLPEIADVAAAFGPDRELAEALRANTTTRESQLMAPMIYPVDELTTDEALKWLLESQVTETIDVLCHRLLRKLPTAQEVAERAWKQGSVMARYGALRLGANLLPANMDKLKMMAREELEKYESATRSLATMLLDDIAWRRESL